MQNYILFFYTRLIRNQLASLSLFLDSLTTTGPANIDLRSIVVVVVVVVIRE